MCMYKAHMHTVHTGTLCLYAQSAYRHTHIQSNIEITKQRVFKCIHDAKGGHTRGTKKKKQESRETQGEKQEQEQESEEEQE